MKILKYLSDEGEQLYEQEAIPAVTELADAREIKAARIVLEAVQRKLDELRKETERKPKRSDDLSKDIVYLLGMEGMANWVLDLPREARKYLESRKGEE